VGCTPSFDTRAQKIARDLIKIFQAGEISFGFLGEQEPCSGEEVLSVGHLPYFKDLSKKAIKTFKDWNVTHLVTIDPHSYDAFKNHYKTDHHSQSNIPIPIHYPEYLAENLNKGRLSFNSQKNTINKRITFHDPCYLARHNNIFDYPRDVLKALPGVELIEMKNNRDQTICCGGGGGRMWLETNPEERFSDIRVAEALETGAEILATACPYCISCLEDSIKVKGIDDLVVLDIAEIVAFALD
jgi:Fe-S oxidoreductase